jgi:hypothetical protein
MSAYDPFKFAIVTGSDSGIGKATAVALAEKGLDVGITYHSDEEGARDTAREVEATGARAIVVRLDTSDLEEAPRVVEDLARQLGGIHVLVNNAGTGHETPFLELDLDTWRHVMDTDVTGAFLAAQVCARRMVAQGQGGRIVNVTSVHEHAPLDGSTAYVAAKHAMGGMTKNMALELAEHGITVNSVGPGEIATPMTGQEDEDPRGTDRPGIPAGRPGDAREIAHTICHIAAPESSYITGASYIVDGGMLLMGPKANQIAMGDG